MAVSTLAKINESNRRNREIAEREALYRRGMPFEPEIAHRMTKPKQAEAMHQVFVDIRGEQGSRPISPKFFGQDGEEAAGRFLEAINSVICLGRLKGWGNARVETAVHVI